MNTFEALMKIAALLAKGNVKESLEYYNEPTESSPPLSECTHYFEQLLSSLPEDIKVKYCFELNGINNEIADLKDGRYYERLHSPGIPLITTIGDRLQYRLELLIDAIANDKPGFMESGNKT
ncbi:MAG: hypothetical protein IJ060_06270 [Oscillospiraceae bacterium]|nr:hypothetical protein [Oscillospiraceae bacterium]